MWNKTTISGLPTEEKQYLCIRKNSKNIEMLTWNSFYNVWDCADGDDYDCDAEAIEYWCELPELPNFIEVGDIITEDGKEAVKCIKILDSNDLVWESLDGKSSACDSISNFKKI